MCLFSILLVPSVFVIFFYSIWVEFVGSVFLFTYNVEVWHIDFKLSSFLLYAVEEMMTSEEDENPMGQSG